MKELTITYAGITIFSGEVDEFQWSDTANAVTVVGKTKPRSAAGGGGLLELLTAARRQPAAADTDPQGESE